MKNNDGRMQSLNDMISYGNDGNSNQVTYTKTTTTRNSQPAGQSSQYSYTKTSQAYPSQNQNQTSTVTKRVVRTEEPAQTSYTTQTVTTKKVTTTTTRGGQSSSTQMNVSKYSNTGSTGGNRNQTTTTTTTYNRGGQNTYAPNNNSQVYRGNQKNVIPPKKIGNTSSYSANKYQPKQPQTNSYNNKSRSPEPGSLKKKTINRGSPVENVQITHIIYTSRATDFHITEKLDLENLNSQPIKISNSDRARLQRSGKVTATCSCDGVEIAQPKPINLQGTTTIYQHAQGIGMTNDKNKDINPMFYSSEIKKLKPINRGKDKEKLENIETFRSYGKQYNTVSSTSNTKYNPKSSTYNRGGMNNSSTQKKSYASGVSNNTYNRGGMGSSVKTTSTVYRGSNVGGGDGEIIKETNTKVQMGSRSQYNQTKPTTYTTSERKVYNQKSFFNK